MADLPGPAGPRCECGKCAGVTAVRRTTAHRSASRPSCAIWRAPPTPTWTTTGGRRQRFRDIDAFDLVGCVEQLAAVMAEITRCRGWTFHAEDRAARNTVRRERLTPDRYHRMSPRELAALPALPAAEQLLTDDLLELLTHRYAADLALYRSRFGEPRAGHQRAGLSDGRCAGAASPTDRGRCHRRARVPGNCTRTAAVARARAAKPSAGRVCPLRRPACKGRCTRHGGCATAAAASHPGGVGGAGQWIARARGAARRRLP